MTLNLFLIDHWSKSCMCPLPLTTKDEYQKNVDFECYRSHFEC